MVEEKTLREYFGREVNGLVFLVDGQPLVQVEIHEDEGYSNGKRLTGEYAVYWRVNDVSVQKMRRWEDLIIRSYFSNCSGGGCAVMEPWKVKGEYSYEENGKGYHKDLLWFLFGSKKNLDSYDWELHQIHEKFLNDKNDVIQFATHDVEGHFGLDFLLQADVGKSRHSDSEPEPELIFLQVVPYVPQESLANILKESCYPAVDDATIEEIIKKIMAFVHAYHSRP